MDCFGGTVCCFCCVRVEVLDDNRTLRVRMSSSLLRNSRTEARSSGRLCQVDVLSGGRSE